MQVLDNLETALQEGVANVFGLGMKIWLFEKDRWSFEWLVGFFASICVVLVGPRQRVPIGQQIFTPTTFRFVAAARVGLDTVCWPTVAHYRHCCGAMLALQRRCSAFAL